MEAKKLQLFIIIIMNIELSQFVIDIYRQYFGFLATRTRLGGRKDAFYEFHLAEDSQSDQ